jgi:hypothetical protein
MKTNPCFIIAHRYVRGYNSYIEHYINNINLFYENALTIIVDNNSPYKDDVLDKFKNKNNIILLDNNTEHKFEQGAYLVGITYLIENNLVDNYDYYVFTQDTYILKNKYNFDELIENNIYACPISWGMGTQDLSISLIKPYLDKLELWDDNLQINYNSHLLNPSCYSEDVLSKILHCYCTVYVIHKDKINNLHTYLKKIKITNRWESELGERYFAWVLYKLNNNRNYQIDHNPYALYDPYSINLNDDFEYGYFAKQQQRKRENIID